VPVRVRSMVAMIPPLAAAVVNEEAINRTLVTDKMLPTIFATPWARRDRGMVGAASCAATRYTAAVDRVPAWTGCASLPHPVRPGGVLSHARLVPVAYHREHPYELDAEACAGRNRL